MSDPLKPVKLNQIDGNQRVAPDDKARNSMTPLPNPTIAQSLGALLKSARNIMRKDKGLNGDLDRLPMLTWIMSLKFLDGLEMQREGEARLAGKPKPPPDYTPCSPPFWTKPSKENCKGTQSPASPRSISTIEQSN
jgi:hypothetical protein